MATNGLAKAIDYMEKIGLDNIARHERELTEYCMQQMAEVPGMRLFGTADGRMRWCRFSWATSITSTWVLFSTAWA